MSGEVEYLVELNDLLSGDEIEFETVPKETKSSNDDVKKPLQNKPSTSRANIMTNIKQEGVKKEGVRKGVRGPRQPKHSSYICDVCGNIYPSQGRLTEHIKLHNGIKPHECEYVKKKVAFNSSLMLFLIHYRICGHRFAQTQQLARHMNTHTGNRPYKCSYCPAAFADLSTRNKHHRYL